MCYRQFENIHLADVSVRLDRVFRAIEQSKKHAVAKKKKEMACLYAQNCDC